MTSQTVELRWRKHLENAHYVDYYLYRAIRKYGVSHFHIETIEEVSNDLLGEREKYWIEYYDSFLKGYNMTRGGEGNQLYSQEQIYLLWDQGLLINQIAEKIGCVKSVVYECLLDYDNYSAQESLKRRSINNQKKVCQFDIHGKYIQTFNSEQEAAKSVGIDNGAIGQCCNNFQKYKTAKGYLWTWETDKNSIQEKVKQLNKSRRSTPFMQAVVQLDNENNILAVYSSAKTAAQYLGREKDSHIGDCCKGRRETCFGYKWRYYSDLQTLDR